MLRRSGTHFHAQAVRSSCTSAVHAVVADGCDQNLTRLTTLPSLKSQPQQGQATSTAACCCYAAILVVEGVGLGLCLGTDLPNLLARHHRSLTTQQRKGRAATVLNM